MCISLLGERRRTWMESDHRLPALAGRWGKSANSAGALIGVLLRAGASGLPLAKPGMHVAKQGFLAADERG
jgi:hypothetical protein